jgi:hypothetical protein
LYYAILFIVKDLGCLDLLGHSTFRLLVERGVALFFPVQAFICFGWCRLDILSTVIVWYYLALSLL